MNYPSDITDQEWELIRHHFEYENGYGNRRKYPVRTMPNAALIVKKGKKPETAVYCSSIK